MYKKRVGTSGIRGQLYETKLISLIHFRAKYDANIKEYNLATNVDEIGTFDDICFKAKIKVKGRYKPVAVFLQAKHREGDKVLTLNSKNDLAKYFDSYLSIRRAFKPGADVLFKGKFDETECFFVMYTTAKDDRNIVKFESDFAPKLNNLIGTGENGLQPIYKDEDVEFLCEIIMKEQFSTLAGQMAKFLCDSDSVNGILSMNDDLVLLYHVILGQRVFDLSDIQLRNEEEEHRIATFRKDFFISHDEYLMVFKETLYIEILKKRKLEEAQVNDYLSTFLNRPADMTAALSELIGSVLTYNKKGKLEFVNKSTADDVKRQLEKVNITQTRVDEATELGARAILTSRQFKVPAAFGNRDLTVRGKVDVNFENALDILKDKLVILLHEAQPDNLVNIDESLGENFLQINAGIASAIGNVFVSDKDPRLIKFTDNFEALEPLAKRLFVKVQSEVPNLQEYRFQAKLRTFPKLCFINENESHETVNGEMIALGEYVGKFLCEADDPIMSIDNELVLRYHVILGQKVIAVSEIYCRNEDEEHRIASFQQNFLENEEEFVVSFKASLFREVVRSRKLEENERDNLLSTFLDEPSEITVLSKLIGTTVEHKDGKLKFIDHNMSENMKKRLDTVDISQAIVDAAIEASAKEILSVRQFKVLASFGNKDWTIKCKKGIKVERRLKHLNMKMSELIKNAGTDKIVVLNESLEDGLLKPSGSIAGLVGNMLVPDSNSKLMKITDDWESLGELSKRLFVKLNTIPDLHEYRFDVKVKKFPKHSFVRRVNDEDLVKDFLKKLLFYTNQADESGVEEILKGEIEDHESRNVKTFQVTSDAIFLKYHDEIQTWWMLPKQGPYLTKQCKLYENSLEQIVDKPLTSVMTLMYKLKLQYNLAHTFNEDTIKSLKLAEQLSGTIFITDNTALTVAKILQCLQNKDHAVLELKYILNLRANDYNAVRKELADTDKNKTLIVVWTENNNNWNRRLRNIATDVSDKRLLFVTNTMLVETVQSHFEQARNIVNDDRIRLIDMSDESKNNIIQNTKVTFQEKEVGLDLFADETASEFIKGDVLNEIINNEPIVLGKTVTNLNYEKLKHLYTERRVVHSDNLRPNYREPGAGTFLSTLYDIQRDVALITAKPGMGKSTLLTHLSLQTKEMNPNVWIVRINLLDNSRQFNKWQKHKTVIDTLETLRFMCRVVLGETCDKINKLTITLEEADGAVNFKDCNGDEWTVFELNMFLHFYNTKEVIFLFDGFDEVCPHYIDEVVTLMRVVRDYPKRHTIWITTRSYDDVKSILEAEFGKSYELQHFTETEQGEYLSRFWKSKIILKDLKHEQYHNICTFMEFMSHHYYRLDKNQHIKRLDIEKHQILYIKVCLNYLGHLRNEIDVYPASVVDTFNSLFGDCHHSVQFMEDFDTPLYLYLIADYLQSQIKDTDITSNKWNLNINAFTIYDRFFETKLKEIRFQEKNKIDLNISDNRIIYDEIKADFFAKHKRLGAFAAFHQDVDKIFNYRERNEIKETLEKIKGATEKTGLIQSVANGVPVFVHMTFTEYFAVEYICDLLKTENTNEKRISTWDFILNIMFFKSSENVRNVLNYKIRTDENLCNIANESEEIVFDLLLEQAKGVYTYNENDFSKELYLKIKLGLAEALSDDLSNFIHLLYKLKVKLTEIYLECTDTESTRSILLFMHLIQKKRRKLNLADFARRVKEIAKRRPPKNIRRRKYKNPVVHIEQDPESRGHTESTASDPTADINQNTDVKTKVAVSENNE